MCHASELCETPCSEDMHFSTPKYDRSHFVQTTVEEQTSAVVAASIIKIKTDRRVVAKLMVFVNRNAKIAKFVGIDEDFPK